jgi:hypothetical protein
VATPAVEETRVIDGRTTGGEAPRQSEHFSFDAVICSGDERMLRLIELASKKFRRGTTEIIEAPKRMKLLAKVVVLLGISLMIVGVAWRGISIENIERIWDNLLARPTGPLKFRFILQPSMAAIIAIREGLYDARKSRSPFAWTILTNANERAGRLREGINATSKILLLGLAIDTIYQIIVFKTFYPYEALIIAVLLALVPYVVIRSLTLRIARKYHPNRDGANAAPNS